MIKILFINKNSLISLLFSFLIFLIFYFSLPSEGIVGGDWTFPYDEKSLIEWAKISSWNSHINFGDNSTLSLNMFYYKLLVNFLYFTGINVEDLQFVIITLFFIIGQLSFVLLIKYYLNTANYIDIFLINLFSLFYIFSPVSFNFLTIGWIFSNISYLLIPLFIFFLLNGIKKESNKYLFFSALVLSISLLQAQSIVWYFLVSFVFLFDPKIKKKLFLKSFFKIIVFTIFLNLHWILPILYDNNASVKVFPNLSLTMETLSMDINLNYYNIFKFYSTTYNGFFEYWIKRHFISFSHFISLIPLLLTLLLIKDNKNKFYKFYLGYLFFFINSLILVNLLKSGFLTEFTFLSPLRNLSRTIIILPFLFYFLIMCLLIPKLRDFNKYKKFFLIFIIIINLLNILPWVKDLSYSENEVIDIDSSVFKMRSYDLPKDYQEFYNKLYIDQNKFTRSLYLPYGSLINFNNDILFLGSFFSIVDIYSATSEVPGLISIGSGRFSSSKLFIMENFYKNYDPKLTKELFKNLYSVDIFIYRKNIPARSIFSIYEFKDFFSDRSLYKKYFESENILAYERIKKNSLLEVINSKHKSSKYNVSLLNKNMVNFSRENDAIIFIKEIESKNNTLVFHESYSKSWCLLNVNNYLEANYFLKKFLIIKNYFVMGCGKNHSQAFLYSNAWQIDNFKNIILIFKPQIGYIVALFIYWILVGICFLFYIKKIYTKKKDKVIKV